MVADGVRASVVMAVHNGADTLPRQLRAVDEQAADCVDLILVDDASGDGSWALLCAFAARHAHAQAVRRGSCAGKAACVNEAVRLASGDVVVLVDQDDVIGPGYVRRLAQAAARDGLAFGRMEYALLNDADHVTALWDHPDQDRAAVRFRGPDGHLWRVRVGPGCCLGVRRDIFDRLGGFATDIGCTDDVDFCLRATALGHPYRQAPDAVISYRFREGGAALFRQRRWYGRSWCLLEDKYRSDGLVPRATATVVRAAVAATGKLLSPARARRLQGAAELGFSLGQLQGRVRGSGWSPGKRQPGPFTVDVSTAPATEPE